MTDIVEFTRLVEPASSNEEQLRRQVSPDGTRAFILTRNANVRTDRNRYEIRLLDLRPSRLAVGRYEEPVVVASLEPLVDDYSGFPSVSELRWVGNRTIAFKARLRDAVYQAFRVDIVTRVLTQMTFAQGSVMAFAVSEDLGTVLYAARLNNPPYREGQPGLVVGNQSFGSVMHGQTIAEAQVGKFRYFVAERSNPRRPRALGNDVFEASTPWPLMAISPDGQWAVVPHLEPGRQAGWVKDYPLVAEATSAFGLSQGMDPLSYFSRPGSYIPTRLLAYRVADGRAQAVIDAPDSGAPRGVTRLLWSDRGRSLIIAGTHLPRQVAGSVQSAAAHVVEYWPGTGRWNVIAEAIGRIKDASLGPGEVLGVTDARGVRRFQRQDGGGWQELHTDTILEASRSDLASDWKLRIRQTLNTPPEIIAEGPSGRWVELTRMNTQVTPAWGSMRRYDWKDVKGREWAGGLLVPADYSAGRRWPLVIQTYGFHPNNFYLDGANHAEAFTSAFAGRAFLQARLLVLAVPVAASSGMPVDGRERMGAWIDGVRAAIESLVSEGLVDRDRIGIIGWSTTGERVLNQITFTETPIRAVTIADGDSNTLYSSAVLYGFSEYVTDRKARVNGGLPAGETLGAWVRNDPSLNTDCITAAVRIERYGSIVGNNWDIYALLRRQYKAAEMLVIPKGTHGLMTPSERMLSLQGNVDWFRFWLTGGERVDPYLFGESDETLREQYRQWRQMAELKAADDAKPMCKRKAEGL